MGGSFQQSSSKSKSKPVDITPAEYRALRPGVYDTLSSLLDGGPSYSGPLVADLTGAERAGLGSVGAAADPTRSNAGRGQLEATLSGAYLSPDSNPFLADYIAAAQRPTLQAYDDRVIQDRATFARAGHRLPASSPFAYARSVGERALFDSLADTSTRIAGEAYNAERGRQVQAAGQLEQINAGDFSRAVDNLKAQALPRLIEQLGYDKGLEEFRRRVALMAQAAGIAGDLSSQFSSESSASSNSIGVSAQLGSVSTTV